MRGMNWRAVVRVVIRVHLLRRNDRRCFGLSTVVVVVINTAVLDVILRTRTVCADEWDALAGKPLLLQANGISLATYCVDESPAQVA